MTTNNPSVTAMADSADRAALANRTLPQMTLSTATNPLTAVQPPITGETSAQRALDRFRVQGNAVVTGGGGNIANVAIRALLDHGLAQVTLLDLSRTLDGTQDQTAQLRNDYPHAKIYTIAVDVTDDDAVKAAMAEAHRTMGAINILCCFAGVVGCVHSIHVSAADWRKVVDVNLTGSFLCAQAAARHMIEDGHSGSIMLTASISAHRVNFPQPQAAYNVSKAGVKHLAQNLAAEWAAHGIRVNSMSPGYVDTVLNAGDNLAHVRAVWAQRCPMGRMADPEELTGAVVLLVSNRAGRYITGTDLVVDGGMCCF